MRIVILGQGGREQALAQACLKSSNVSQLFIIPGNAGMTCAGLQCVALSQEDDIVQFCIKEKIDLVIPGNESVILSSIKIKLKALEIPCFSPDPSVARLESSKVFCKNILKAAGLLTANFQLIKNQNEGLEIIQRHDFKKPLVLKADGLAQGKGVWVCADKTTAQKSFEQLTQSFGFPILAEKCLEGRELSAFAVCNGKRFTILGTAVDYKRINDNPFSANTGGMGAYSPCHFIDQKDEKEIENIFQKTLQTLENQNLSFQGFLFAGLMKTNEGLAVIEFNVRMGDPETQALLPRLKTNLLDIILEKTNKCDVSSDQSVHVVVVSSGYPGSAMQLGHKIQMQNDFYRKNLVYFSGVKAKDGALINSGGRVVGVTALDKSVQSAREKAYKLVEQVHFEGAYYRRDIGL